MNYLILGGTGTLGKALTRELLMKPESRVTIFSRDELKQQEMRAEYRSDSRLSFAVGDIRDRDALRSVMGRGFESVLHVAALKHVDVLEANPEESVKTNILGTINAADAAVEARIPYFAFSSTDKAVDPINVYGFSKAISEKLLFARNNRPGGITRFSVYRWGNVVGSRGSAIHAFAKGLKERGQVDITHSDMTRFWIRIEDAAHYMIRSFRSAFMSEPMLPPIKAAPVLTVVDVIAELLGVKDMEVNFIGMRPGEKMHEALKSAHANAPLTSDGGPQYTRDELKALIRPILGVG